MAASPASPTDGRGHECPREDRLAPEPPECRPERKRVLHVAHAHAADQVADQEDTSGRQPEQQCSARSGQILRPEASGHHGDGDRNCERADDPVGKSMLFVVDHRQPTTDPQQPGQADCQHSTVPVGSYDHDDGHGGHACDGRLDEWDLDRIGFAARRGLVGVVAGHQARLPGPTVHPNSPTRPSARW